MAEDELQTPTMEELEAEADRLTGLYREGEALVGEGKEIAEDLGILGGGKPPKPEVKPSWPPWIPVPVGAKNPAHNWADSVYSIVESFHAANPGRITRTSLLQLAAADPQTGLTNLAEGEQPAAAELANRILIAGFTYFYEPARINAIADDLNAQTGSILNGRNSYASAAGRTTTWYLNRAGVRLIRDVYLAPTLPDAAMQTASWATCPTAPPTDRISCLEKYRGDPEVDRQLDILYHPWHGGDYDASSWLQVVNGSDGERYAVLRVGESEFKAKLGFAISLGIGTGWLVAGAAAYGLWRVGKQRKWFK